MRNSSPWGICIYIVSSLLAQLVEGVVLEPRVWPWRSDPTPRFDLQPIAEDIEAQLIFPTNSLNDQYSVQMLALCYAEMMETALQSRSTQQAADPLKEILPLKLAKGYPHDNNLKGVTIRYAMFERDASNPEMTRGSFLRLVDLAKRHAVDSGSGSRAAKVSLFTTGNVPIGCAYFGPVDQFNFGRPRDGDGLIATTSDNTDTLPAGTSTSGRGKRLGDPRCVWDNDRILH